jgi:hypothetical protein
VHGDPGVGSGAGGVVNGFLIAVLFVGALVLFLANMVRIVEFLLRHWY